METWQGKKSSQIVLYDTQVSVPQETKTFSLIQEDISGFSHCLPSNSDSESQVYAKHESKEPVFGADLGLGQWTTASCLLAPNLRLCISLRLFSKSSLKLLVRSTRQLGHVLCCVFRSFSFQRTRHTAAADAFQVNDTRVRHLDQRLPAQTQPTTLGLGK